LLTRALYDNPLWNGACLIDYTLARAYLEMGKIEDGKHWFDKAELRMAAWEQEAKDLAYQFPIKYWIIDFLEAQVQRRDARSLLESKAPSDQASQPSRRARPL
jgi:hypothetical protein